MKGNKNILNFWNYFNGIGSVSRIVLFGYMNGRVGNSEVAGVVGEWDVDGVKEKGEYLVGGCAERGLLLANTFFQHKVIHRHTWIN